LLGRWIMRFFEGVSLLHTSHLVLQVERWNVKNWRLHLVLVKATQQNMTDLKQRMEMPQLKGISRHLLQQAMRRHLRSLHSRQMKHLDEEVGAVSLLRPAYQHRSYLHQLRSYQGLRFRHLCGRSHLRCGRLNRRLQHLPLYWRRLGELLRMDHFLALPVDSFNQPASLQRLRRTSQ
jgi:hypothetical protein